MPTPGPLACRWLRAPRRVARGTPRLLHPRRSHCAPMILTISRARCKPCLVTADRGPLELVTNRRSILSSSTSLQGSMEARATAGVMRPGFGSYPFSRLAGAALRSLLADFALGLLASLLERVPRPYPSRDSPPFSSGLRSAGVGQARLTCQAVRRGSRRRLKPAQIWPMLACTPAWTPTHHQTGTHVDRNAERQELSLDNDRPASPDFSPWKGIPAARPWLERL